MLASVRDIAIVLLALESLVIGVLLMVLLLQIRQLARILQEEIAPLLDSANDTANRVKGTVGLVSESVVDPIIRLRSYSAGTREVLQSLFAIRRRTKGPNRSSDGDVS